MMARTIQLVCSLTFVLITEYAFAEDVRVAVAANFREAFASVTQLYHQATGARPVGVFGSSGMLYAQITQGAPYHLFLSADRERPAKLAADGLTAGAVRVYAVGRLALWAPQRSAAPEVLSDGRFALATPQLAPYGTAARTCLERLGMWRAIESAAVYGTSVSQTYHFIASGAVPAGFVAYAQLVSQQVPPGEIWLAPTSCYDPIEQCAVVLRGRMEAEASRFLAFLLSDQVQHRLEALGYARP